jgi:pseudouridine kinase
VARNVAENLLRLGVDAHLISVLGDDAFAAVLRQSAAGIGLNLEACATVAGARTATYLSLHGTDGDMGVAVNDMDILDHLTPVLLESRRSLLQSADAVVVDSNVRADVLDWLALNLQGKPLFAESVSVAKCAKLVPVLGALHTLKANRMEGEAMSGCSIGSPQSAMDAALALHRRGVGRVVISLGAQGAVWCDAAGHCGHRAVRPVQMASATGAGDAMLSGLVFGHLQGMALDLSVEWAMACAELTLSSTFANSPELCIDAVQSRLDFS